jgi:hypothetical protein
MPDPTIVEALIERGPTDVSAAVAPLKDFFSKPERRAALRLGVLGVVERQRDKRQWENATAGFTRLFDKVRDGLPDGPLHFNAKSIMRFALGNFENQDHRLEAFLAMYVIHQVETRPNLVDDDMLVNEAFSIGNTLTGVREYLRSGKSVVLAPYTSGYDVRGVLRTMQMALGTSDDHIKALLFEGTAGAKPISNYVMYRYSTRRGQLVKSFLTILSPEVNDLGCYTFTHVYGPEDINSRRISRGALIGFQQSIYFLAGGGMIRERGSTAASLGRGLKAFAIPHAAFVPDHRLLTGLMLSNSLSWHPIVARFAMMHVGFSSRVGEITDETVGIRFFDGSKLQGDISDACATFKLGGPTYAEDALAYVLEKINNYPKIDLDGSEGLLRALAIEEGREPPE